MQLASHPTGEDTGLALSGGGAIGVPIGVHLGNECRGNLALDYLIPLGIAGGVGALLIPLHPAGLSPFIIVGVVYFAATVLTEQLTGH